MGNHVGAQTEPPPLFEAEIDAEPMLPAPDEVVFRMRQAILDANANDGTELDRHAFNLTFYGLGLRFHWDSDTYDDLCARAADANARTLLYLSDAQAHLLKAYDPAFLVDTIVTRMQQVRDWLAGQGWYDYAHAPRRCCPVIADRDRHTDDHRCARGRLAVLEPRLQHAERPGRMARFLLPTCGAYRWFADAISPGRAAG